MDKIKVTSNKDNTSIEELEYAIVSKNYLGAEESLILLIRQYVENKVDLVVAPFDRTLTKDQRELESYQVIEKMAVLITTWFSDKNYKPSDNTYAFICLQKMFLGNLFAASSYHSTDHILTNLGLMGKTEYTAAELQKLLFVITNESTLEIPWDIMFKHLPEHSILAYSGLVRSINIQLTQRAQNSIKRLTDAASYAPVVKSSNISNLSPLTSTFFNCSNLIVSNKYDIKKWVVKSLEKFMDDFLTPGLQKRIKSEVKQVLSPNKPVLLLPCEFYFSTHAMYRGWHTSLASLKHNFRVVGLGLKGVSFNDVSKADFDHVIEFEDKHCIEKAIKEVLKVKPDIIIYPSIGMSMWAPLMATLRLAPVQVCLSGHPASTYISTIDYYLLTNCPYPQSEVEHVYSEKLIQTKDLWVDATKIHYDANLFIEKKSKGKIRIIINGVIQKVSWLTIQMCQRLTEQSNVEIEFMFFMTSPKQNIEYFATGSILRRFLPNSKINPFSSYQKYMDLLNTCDFALPTIPFGGSNSNVDIMRLGIPKLLFSDTTDVSSWSDLAMWKPTGLAEFMLCDTMEELETRALELINEPKELERLQKLVAESDVEKQLFTGKSDLPYVVEAINEIINFEKVV